MGIEDCGKGVGKCLRYRDLSVNSLLIGAVLVFPALYLKQYGILVGLVFVLSFVCPGTWVVVKGEYLTVSNLWFRDTVHKNQVETFRLDFEDGKVGKKCTIEARLSDDRVVSLRAVDRVLSSRRATDESRAAILKDLEDWRSEQRGGASPFG